MKPEEDQYTEKARELRFKRSTLKTFSMQVDSLQRQSDVIKQHSERIWLLDKKLTATRRLLAIVSSLAGATLLVQSIHLWLLLAK